MTHTLWQKLGLTNVTLEINTLGSSEARKSFRDILVTYFSAHKNLLDEDSLRRLETNPLRILDSKNKDMQSLINGAPKLMEHLDDESKKHFEKFKTYLNALDIDFVINTRLVRGLDYYNRTVFEWTTQDLGAQGTICAGGRYDGLVEKMGGKPTTAVGLAIGLERLILLMEEQAITIKTKQIAIYIITPSDDAQLKSMQIASLLHNAIAEVIIYNDMSLGSLKNQFRKADKVDADFALILGEEELSNGQISIKPLKSQEPQQTLSLDKAIKYFKDYI
jgi:histidyl-tRNA synthetase